MRSVNRGGGGGGLGWGRPSRVAGSWPLRGRHQGFHGAAFLPGARADPGVSDTVCRQALLWGGGGVAATVLLYKRIGDSLGAEYIFDH